MSHRLVLVGLLLGAILPSIATAAAELTRFAVRQVHQLDVGTPTVRAYLDLTDSEGHPIAELPAASLSVTLGEWQADTLTLERFDPKTRGIAYVFLVDVSRSLDEALFRQMTGSLERWVEDLQPLDRVAVIAFGESSRLLVDFTAHRERLRAALRSLRPSDDETVLHQALADALDLCRRLDPELPGRRAVLVFSDGKDEGSGLSAEDILARLRNEPSPIYAIGFSRLRDAAERQAYLDLLRRFATNSGGLFFAAQEGRLVEAHDAIRDAVGRVWIADFRCPACRPDGSLQQLRLQVNLDGRVLSDGGPVRLLPLSAAASAAPEAGERETGAGAEAEAAGAADALDVPTGASVRGGGFRLLLLGTLLALAALATWWLVATRRRPRLADAPGPETVEHDAVPLDPILPPVGTAVPEPEPVTRPVWKPPPRQPSTEEHPWPEARFVRLIVVRGSRRGRQYNLQVEERAIVGKRSDCDLVLGEEPGIDAQQFELLQRGAELFIRDLSRHDPTLLDGRPIIGMIRIDSDSLIGTGSTILRIVFH